MTVAGRMHSHMCMVCANIVEKFSGNILVCKFTDLTGCIPDPLRVLFGSLSLSSKCVSTGIIGQASPPRPADL